MARTPRIASDARPAGRPAAVRTARGRRSPAAALTRERILATALALIEREGLAAFSIRGLGAALGCEPMSIYHYFPSKGHLLDALVDQVIAEFATRPPPGDPIVRLRQMMYSWRALAHRYPRLFQLLATHRLNTPTGVRVIDEVMELVRDAVPDIREAAQWFRVLSYYVTGAALDETAGYAKGPSAAEPVSDAYVAEHCPHLAAAAPYFKQQWWDSTFELGIESLLDVLRARSHGAEPVPPKPIVRPKH
jgi:AcrR family transcriptional regulator